MAARFGLGRLASLSADHCEALIAWCLKATASDSLDWLERTRWQSVIEVIGQNSLESMVPAPAALLVAYLGKDSSGWLPCIQSLELVETAEPLIVAGSAGLGSAFQVSHEAETLAQLLAALASDGSADWIVVAGEPCLVPAGLLSELDRFDDDRFAVLSFLSNSAGPLSFPFPGSAVPWAPNGLSPDRVTERLRASSVQTSPVPVPLAAGPVVAFSTSVVRMLPDNWSEGCESWDEVVATYSLAAQARGLTCLLDTRTFVQRAADLRGLVDFKHKVLPRLKHRYPWCEFAFDLTIQDESSPFRLEHRLARTRVNGLDVLLDGTCLGPIEMGTQVGLVAICNALAKMTEVSSIGITLLGPVPPYAAHLGQDPKVSFIRQTSVSLDTDRHFDVSYRAFQPDESYPLELYRAHADRVVVSILDLIAYANSSYFAAGDFQASYRLALNSVVRNVDAVTTISHDVVESVRMLRIPIDLSRLFPVPYGTEHLDLVTEKRMPAAFASSPDSRFIFCLGTNYGHKNRDLAIRTNNVLRQRGNDVRLVLAGPSVPFGSSRVLESEALVQSGDPGVMVIGDIPSEERNWLLAHAEVVLYPTSAEGFGLVPYEAASMGTPTVFVPFGPLAEIAGSLPVEAADWSPVSFADAVEAMLRNPALARAQVDALLTAARRSTWGMTAEELVRVFQATLARPSVVQ